ncbi:MAG: hypothetical protein IKE29_21765 [Paenibacillus sp.]|uniref:hypothetical protein n=1 Tax=Paenibacillus sp. TaxID=58172 RepID=UPI0025D87AD6|nr:hypothetical protein [Paenibacillus sp.]MBR2567219.1 hypothetical protein [Paenibacillus sp.]
MCEFDIRFLPPEAVKREIGGQVEHQGPATTERLLCIRRLWGELTRQNGQLHKLSSQPKARRQMCASEWEYHE